MMILTWPSVYCDVTLFTHMAKQKRKQKNRKLQQTNKTVTWQHLIRCLLEYEWQSIVTHMTVWTDWLIWTSSSFKRRRHNLKVSRNCTKAFLIGWKESRQLQVILLQRMMQSEQVRVWGYPPEWNVVLRKHNRVSEHGGKRSKLFEASLAVITWKPHDNDVLISIYCDVTTHHFCSLLFIATIAYWYVRHIASESLDDPFKATFFADFGGAVDVIDGEDLSKAVEK